MKPLIILATVYHKGWASLEYQKDFQVAEITPINMS